MILLSSFSIKGQCVNFSFDQSQDGTDILVDLRVENFMDILSVQMAFGYSSENLELLDVTSSTPLGINASNFNLTTPGYIAFVWTEAEEKTLIDGSSLLQFRFGIVGPNPSTLVILDQNPLFVEVVDSSVEPICFTTEPIIINDNRAKIFGKISHDLDSDCIDNNDDLPLGGWKVRLTSNTETYYAISNNSGKYIIPVELGEYTIEVLTINDLWTPCIPSKNITVDTEGEEYDVPFVISPNQESSALSVSIKTQRLRRCFNNNFHIKYRNDGTVEATNTEINILLDDNLDYVDASINGVALNGQTLNIDLGTLGPGEVGAFNITVNVNCENTVLGESLCAEAEITSDDSMIPPSEWDGAVLMSEVSCEEDSVAITIRNIGTNDVIAPLEFIVIEDDVMFHSNQTNPLMNEQRRFKFEDNGAVYRVVVDQPEGYPYGIFDTDFIQSCDDDNAGTYKFVSMFPNADDAPVVDIECHEVVGSFDPNDILAYPAGYREKHEIDLGQDIEYTIRFQNTGTDTAFNIAIENTIDPSLDIESLIEGSSSHEYTLTVLENGTLRFDFYNVLLPQSAVNNLGSNGFVSYKISQKPDLELGTEINNTADIYFDFNEAIVTNTYTHTIGEEYIKIMLDDKTVVLDNQVITAPNPSSDIMMIEVPSTIKDISYVLYNANGIVVNAANCPSNAFYINKGMMFSGIYILEIKSNNQTIGRKKLIFN